MDNVFFYCRGVILFAMTCGKLPYNDKSLKYLIEQTKKKVVFPEKLSLSSGKPRAHFSLTHEKNPSGSGAGCSKLG